MHGERWARGDSEPKRKFKIAREIIVHYKDTEYMTTSK